MLKQLNSVSAILAGIVMATAASSVMAQDSRKQAPKEIRTERVTALESIPDRSRGTISSSGSKSAIVAREQEGRVQLAGDKEKVIEAMQRALNSTREPGAVRDIGILSFEKNMHFLAIKLEKQGALYLQLEPSGGGIQAIFHVGDLNALYCNGGCGSCNLVPGCLADGSGPHCTCDGAGELGLTDCKLYPVRHNIHQLADQFNSELLALGFEPATDRTSTGGGPGAVKAALRTVAPGRVDPIKRPNN